MTAALITAACAGVYSVGHPKRALALGGILVIGLILLDLGGRRGTLADQHRWVPWAWIALFLVTDVRLVQADPLEVATGAVNIQHIVQLAMYAIVAALAIRARGSMLALFPRPVPKGLLVAFPLFATASAAWSLIPLYTFVRAMELVVLALLALLVVRIWASDPTAGTEIFRRTLRLFVQVVTILIPIGFIFGEAEGTRFAWPGAAPTLAATYLGAAFLILVIGGRAFTGFSLFTYWARLPLFGAALFLAQTRSVLFGVVFGSAVALWFRGREKPSARYLGFIYYIVGAILALTLAATNLFDYLSRGESTQTLYSLTGRIPLWQFALSRFDSIGDWISGFGYGSSRIILLSAEEFQWAGSAHSVWMEVLLGTGLVGLSLIITMTVTLAFWLAKRRLFDVVNVVSLSILGYLLMLSPILESFILPGAGFGLFALLHAPALARRAILGQRRRQAVTPERTPSPT